MVMDGKSHNEDHPHLLDSETAQEIVAALGQGVIILDADGRFEYVNPAFARMVGSSPAALIGSPSTDLVHADDLPTLLRARQRRRAGKTTTYEIRLLCPDNPDNSVIHTRVTGAPRRQNGKVTGALLIVRDISARQQAEKALRESEQEAQAHFAAAQRQAQELALLDKVRTAVAREMDLNIIVRTVVEAIQETFGYTLVSLYLLRGERLVLQHQVGYDREIKEIPITEGISGRVVHTAEPVLLRDVSTDPAFLGAIEGIVSEMCVPLFDQDRVVGTLNVESTEVQVLTEDDLQLLVALSKDINIAIYRARLYREMQESREQLQLVVSNAPIIFWAVDREGKFTHATGKGLEGLGLKPDDMVGHSIFELFGSEIARLAQIFQRAINDEESEVTVDIAGTKFTARYSTLRDEAGEITGVTGVALDITAQARAEALLRASEEKYRRVVNTVGDVIFQTNLEGTWTFLNRAWTELTGFPVAECLGESSLVFVHPEDQEICRTEFRRLIEHNEKYLRYEVRFLTKTGNYRWMEVHTRTMEDEAGKVSGTSGLLRDVTGRKQREWELESFAAVTRALRQANTRTQMLPIILDQALELLQASGALFVTHPDGDRKQIELGRGDWRHLSAQQLSPGDNGTGFEVDSGAVYSNDDARTVLPGDLASLLHPHYAVIAAPVGRSDEVDGVIWLGRTQPFTAIEVQAMKAIVEITATALERSRLLESLEQRVIDRTQELVVAHERLQELNQLKTKFIGDVSHELRTPAASIRLYLDLLARGREGMQETYLTKLQESGRRLAHIVESILQFSHLTETAGDQNPSVVDLNEITAAVVDQYHSRAIGKNIELKFLPGTMPPGDDPPSALGVAGLYSQAISYLLDNALKYTNHGSVTVRTYVDEEQHLACVQISDTGKGIEPDEIELVFDRFYRGRKVSQLTIPGGGLGLSLAQQIVVQYGGRIDLESEAGRGTMVQMMLPFAG